MWQIILENKIETISAAIAVFSAIFAWSQARSAKKSYKMQQKVYEDGKAKFNIDYISSSYSYNDNKHKNIYYYFEVSVTNLSDKSTSIKKAQLELVSNDGVFKVNHNDNLKIKRNHEILKIPFIIQPHTAISGWLVFEVPTYIHNELDIDTHYLILEDIHNLIRRKEEIYVMEEGVKK